VRLFLRVAYEFWTLAIVAGGPPSRRKTAEPTPVPTGFGQEARRCSRVTPRDGLSLPKLHRRGYDVCLRATATPARGYRQTLRERSGLSERAADSGVNPMADDARWAGSWRRQRRCLSSGATLVVVMQAAEVRDLDDRAVGRWLACPRDRRAASTATSSAGMLRRTVSVLTHNDSDGKRCRISGRDTHRTDASFMHPPRR
jgi:hypothetical protein